MQIKLQRVYFIYQPQPSTCSLTSPLLLLRRGRVLPGFPEHPRQLKVEALAIVLSYLNSMYVVNVMYADIPSGGFSIRPSQPYKLTISAGVQATVNFQHYNSVCREYFQKPPGRIVHLSNPYSATRKDFTYGGILCSACLNPPFAQPFTGSITPLNIEQRIC